MEAKENLSLVKDQEVWKDILGYEGVYEISSLGRLKSLSRVIETRKGVFANIKEKIKIPILTKEGYFRYKLSNKNKEFFFFAHRLVAFAFIENINNKPQINHIDGNKINNKISNLEWVSGRENSCHKFKKNNCSSRYVGVCFNKNKNKWESSIFILGKSIYLGRYKTEEEAYKSRCDYEKNNNIENKYL
jgi:hypothetical protein